MAHESQPKAEEETVDDMDLEQFMTKPATPAKPRVHISDNACISCEG